jgi:predicted  nucleic acid-binding Zn-ribbon protein
VNTPGTPPIWKSLANKPRAYEALHLLNRCFEATLLSLERLEGLGIFRLESLNEYKVILEHARAETNEELLDTLHEYEMEESARFDGMRREWEKQRRDLDDVFFAAHDRRQEIKEQIIDLQKALERQRPKHKKRGSK